MVTNKQTVDTYERFEKHINNTLSFCSNGSTRKDYTAEQALHFMLKLIGTHVVSLMNENVHTSIVAIRRLFNFFRILFYFMKKHPEMQELIEARIHEFVSQPEKRHKNHCKNLLDFQIMALFSKKVSYQDFKGAYCDEQLDRQVLWILKKIPELDFENKKLKGKGMGVKEEERSKISFECGKTGFFLSVFFVKLHNTLERVGGQNKNIDEISKVLDENFGCLGFEVENTFQKQIFDILKVDDFQKYYSEIGLDRAQNQEALNSLLVKAVKSSRAKGYHGQEHDSQMPEVSDQAEQRAVTLLQ